MARTVAMDNYLDLEIVLHVGRIYVRSSASLTCPYITNFFYRAWWISGREQQLDSLQDPLMTTPGNATVPFWRSGTIIHRLTTRPFWQSLSADIFAGQIIASLIVLTFVAVFLLREWISQNARPGVFEEDEIGGPALGDPPVLEPLPAVQAPIEPNRRFNAGQPLIPLEREDGRRQARAVRPRRGIVQDAQFDRLPRRLENIERARPIRNLAVPVRQFPNMEPQPAPPPLAPENTGASAAIRKGKGREVEDDDEVDDEGLAGLRRRTRRRLDSEDRNRDTQEGVQPGSASSKQPLAASSSSTAVQPTTFEFTFRAPRSAHGNAYDNQDVQTESSPLPATHPLADEPGDALYENTLAPPELAPLWKHVVHPPTPPRSFHISSSISEPDEQPPSHSSPHDQGGSTFRRPPMPSSTVMAEDEESKLQPTSPFGIVPSPGLATYAAPEELEAGSSSAAAGSLNGNPQAVHETEDELNFYFPERRPAVANDEELAPPLAERIPEPNELNGRREPSEDEEDEGEAEAGEDVRDGDPWDLDHDDDDDDDDELVNLNLNGVNRPGIQAQQVQLQEAAEQLNEGGDDLEGGVEDDMEGALEGES